jgi:hypothetical protein
LAFRRELQHRLRIGLAHPLKLLRRWLVVVGQRLHVDGKRTLAADPNSQGKLRAILASMNCFRPRDKLALRGAATRQG